MEGSRLPRSNVTRLLDARKVSYTAVEYDASAFHSADEVAALMGVAATQVYKTIVVLRPDPGARPLLVIVPGDSAVDLKRLAVALGEKRLHAATLREAESLTRLQAGGISALALVGRGFDVVLDESAGRFAADGIYVSGGQRGLNLRIAPSDLVTLTGARVLHAAAPAVERREAGDDHELSADYL